VARTPNPGRIVYNCIVTRKRNKIEIERRIVYNSVVTA